MHILAKMRKIARAKIPKTAKTKNLYLIPTITDFRSFGIKQDQTNMYGWIYLFGMEYLKTKLYKKTKNLSINRKKFHNRNFMKKKKRYKETNPSLKNLISKRAK